MMRFTGFPAAEAGEEGEGSGMSEGRGIEVGIGREAASTREEKKEGGGIRARGWRRRERVGKSGVKLITTPKGREVGAWVTERRERVPSPPCWMERRERRAADM